LGVMQLLKVVEKMAGVATYMMHVIKNIVAQLSVGFIYVSRILFFFTLLFVVLGGHCQKCNLEVMGCVVTLNPGKSSCCSANNCGKTRS